MQKKVYNKYYGSIFFFFFLGFATSINVLGTTRYFKEHHITNTLRLI